MQRLWYEAGVCPLWDRFSMMMVPEMYSWAEIMAAEDVYKRQGFSLFTGLNNFKVLSIFDETSKQRFGFTQNEIDSLLLDYQANEYQGQVKE